jgi:ribonuclease III
LSDLLKQLEAALEYSFHDHQLLLQALTHRSASSNNNERLEFLGDSLLNTAISAQLFRQHSNLEEGELTRLRASLVNKDSLAEIARGIELGEYIALGSGELKSGGQRRDSILADALEALVGAIYIDSDFKSMQTVVLHLFRSRLETDEHAEIPKDCKTQLQEMLQARNMPLPVYVVESVVGQDHRQTFRVCCQVETLGIHARGAASSRRAAEQEAARQALALLADV